MMDREPVDFQVADNPIDNPVGRLNDLSYRRIRELRNGATRLRKVEDAAYESEQVSDDDGRILG